MQPAFVTGAVLPRTGLSSGVSAVSSAPARPVYTTAPGRSEIVASKNAQLKAAKKSNRRRPKKHCPSDINRAAPSFDPTPLLADGLPPVFTLMEEADFVGTAVATEDDVLAFNTGIEDAAAAEAAAAEVARVAARTQSKADKAKAMVVKQASHVAHKEKREASIKAFAEASAAAEAAEAAGADAAVEEEAAPEAEEPVAETEA